MRKINEGIIEDNGNGMWAYMSSKDYMIGDIVADLKNAGRVLPEPNFRTIDCGAHGHIDHPFGRFTNHSCHPNVAVDKHRCLLRAIRPIGRGDEICFDYASESQITTPFDCQCGASNCRGRIS